MSLDRKSLVLDLLLLVLVASIFRFSWLSSNPPSLNWDEASLGYNAYSILKTGKDEWGKFLPISFEAFGEYKLPGYVYTAVPSVALFGLTEFAVRLPSAFFGVLTVVLTYFLIRKITNSRIASLFGSVLLALTPWHFFVSRTAVEANLALFFIVLGGYLFMKGAEKPRLYLLSITSFLVAIFTYNSARVFLPLFVFGLSVFYRKDLFAKKLIGIASILIFFAVYLAAIPLVFKEGSARYTSVGILDQGAINRINEMRGRSHLGESQKRLVYNKVTYFVSRTAVNYAYYFSPTFLLKEGGTQYQFSQPHFGMLYSVEIPLSLIGFFVLFKTKNRYRWLIASWLVLAPLPAAITRETPHVLRSLFMLPTFEILSAVGFLALTRSLWRRQQELAYGFVLFLLAMVLVQAIPYFKTYASTYPNQYSCTWQWGHKQVAQYISNHVHEFDGIVMTKRYGEPHIFLLFYQAIDPQFYQTQANLIRYHESNHAWVDRFSTYLFVNDWELQAKVKALTDLHVGRILVVTSPGNYPKSVSPIETIKFLDGKPAFDLLVIDTAKTKISQTDVMPPPPLRGCYTT